MVVAAVDRDADLDGARSIAEPTVSVVMPVFNTGAMLLAAVRSVVAQTLFAEEPPGYWELLVVDDASTDAETHAALADAAALAESVRVIRNDRAKGAAGARNTGVFAARGRWICFLDSDDLLHPDFYRRRRDAFEAMPDARWRAAHFDVGDAEGRWKPSPLAKRSPCLYRHIAEDYAADRISVLRRPVDVLLRCGCLQIMTVQIDRELLHSTGGFNETFVCAEDYDLFLRLAKVEDLYLAPLDAGIYRTRSGSLTKSGRPMYYGEDRMLIGAKRDRGFDAYRRDIDTRLREVYATFCFHDRAQRRFGHAARHAMRLIRLAPMRSAGWRQLVAALLRR